MGLSLTPHFPLNPPLGAEKSPIQISANRLEVDQNVDRTYFRIHWLVVKWCNEQLNNRTALVKPQMSESRSSTICVIVKQPDHYCGDDLVLSTTLSVNFSQTTIDHRWKKKFWQCIGSTCHIFCAVRICFLWNVLVKYNKVITTMVIGLGRSTTAHIVLCSICVHSIGALAKAVQLFIASFHNQPRYH